VELVKMKKRRRNKSLRLLSHFPFDKSKLYQRRLSKEHKQTNNEKKRERRTNNLHFSFNIFFEDNNCLLLLPLSFVKIR
jgi:hypothetical protein